jgi:hypothetical protein
MTFSRSLFNICFTTMSRLLQPKRYPIVESPCQIDSSSLLTDVVVVVAAANTSIVGVVLECDTGEGIRTE